MTTQFIPTKSEVKKMQEYAKGLAKKINTEMPAQKVIVGGSVAKGTFIRGSNDVDLFVVYSKEKSKDALEKDALRAAKKAFPQAKIQISYAEHPYIKIFMGTHKIDLVPAFEYKKGQELRSSVDRSAEHVKYVKKHLTENKRHEIVLLKQFFKANGIYGAEIKVKGFSGYLCELLILKYGTFKGVLRLFRTKPPFIEIQKTYKQKEIPALLKKFNAPLVVIDPTDKQRNVAAAVSEESLKKIMKLAKEFLKKPNANIFFKKPPTFEERIKKIKNPVIIITKRTPVNDDILWGQVHRLEDKIIKYIDLNGFGQARAFSDMDEETIRVCITAKKQTIEPHFWFRGPLLSMPPHVENFKKANDGCAFKESQGRIWAWKKRSICSVKETVLEFFKKETMPSHISRDVCLI